VRIGDGSGGDLFRRKVYSVKAHQDILILDSRVAPAHLEALVERWFGDMVKIVVDVQRGVIAIGGELHADAEERLLDNGSRQADLWGANYYPGLGPDECIEYTALINIRPSQGNPAMEIGDPNIRARIQQVVFALVGRGEEL
jgi:hypothetical protein